jgi:hypothetical protein
MSTSFSPIFDNASSQLAATSELFAVLRQMVFRKYPETLFVNIQKKRPIKIIKNANWRMHEKH